MKNEDIGRSWNISTSLTSTLYKGFLFKGGYSYGDAKNTIDPGSTALSSWQLNETPAVRVRMGNYSPQRLSDPLLQEIFAFAKDLGFRPSVQGRLSAGVPAANGVTYSLSVLTP